MARQVKSMDFAALDAVADAVSRAKSPLELFQAVCEAIAADVRIGCAGVFAPNEEGRTQLVAAAGLENARLGELESDLGAAGDRWILVPIRRGSIDGGFFACHPTGSRRLSGLAQRFLRLAAGQIASALDRFDREKIVRQKDNLARMFAALSVTNEVIVRARTRDELFEMACEAAVAGGDFTSTLIGLAQPGGDHFRIVAAAGPTAQSARNAQLGTSADLPEGRGVSGQAFRSGRTCVSNDYVAEIKEERLLERVRAEGTRSGGAFPLLCRGEPVGVLLFMSSEKGAFTRELIALLQRLADNVSYALENFDRADERRLADEQEERLSRMFAALSAANEAIMRARTREELFQLVCEAAVHGGRFVKTAIAVATPGKDVLRVVATGGPEAQAAWSLKLSVNADSPEGTGVAGIAFRTRRPCISNGDASEGPEGFRQPATEWGAEASAALPLLKRGASVGVLLFVSSERFPFTRELIALLQRLADNVSFGLENFDLADQRRMVDQQEERLTRMYAALGATNEAIMRASTRAELFTRVCEAAVNGGKFASATISLVEASASYLRETARAGAPPATIGPIRFSTDANDPEGRGLASTAFRTLKPCISNDYLADERGLAFHDRAQAGGIRSYAALPLLPHGRCAGVVSFRSIEKGAFTPELVELLQRVADNVSFALENFDREDERRLAEEQKDRLARMYAALSATNEAIMRVHTPDQLFTRACRAAVKGGKFALVTVAMREPGTGLLREAARAGAQVIVRETARAPTNADGPKCAGDPKCAGVSATALRTKLPCISNDYLADERGVAFRAEPRARGLRSYAALPLLCNGDAVGVLNFWSREIGAFTPELVELLQRLAENVSFALENFDRAEERRLASEQKERLSRMFVALSATNEAIMRAATRAELFELVCQAAVRGGRFASTIIALKDDDGDFLKVVAWAGPKGDMQKTVRLAVSGAYPEGQGLSGTAFRTGQPCIFNDYLADPRNAAFYERALREGNRAGAALPLVAQGRPVGVLVFMSSECGAFTPELVELLTRLATNVSFALENFDRAEEKARADEQIKYLATHDGLTSLPNRAMFNLLLHKTIETARREERRFAVLFIDIDRFKVINDSLGHDAGDALLIEAAGRLRRCLGERDVVARLGGDEFVVILDDASDPRLIEGSARRILSAICEPLQLCGLECRTTASIGIAVFPGDGEDELALTKNADMAMYRAKEEGKNGFRFFVAQNKMLSVERLVFEARLRQALERDEFSLAYQPKVDATTSRVIGVEALLRWTLPDLGALSPNQFIPLAEETGLIVPIGRWVLKTACAQNMAWLRQGLPPLSMAVNLSPRQFSDENLLQDIDEALAASGMPPELLQIEITESMVMRNVARAIELLEIIRGRGVRLAIDDFGTGYSSMALMKKFPVDTIKIDRSFIQDLPDDAEDRAIAQAIISMGKALGLTVVAEGVETAEQAAFLRAHACDEMQGYLFSRPVAPDLVPDLLGPGWLVAANARARRSPLRSAENTAPPRRRAGAVPG